MNHIAELLPSDELLSEIRTKLASAASSRNFSLDFPNDQQQKEDEAQHEDEKKRVM